MNSQTATFWIETLQLMPHIEGGYYKEIYRCQDTMLDPKSGTARSIATSIYYLLEENDFSAFHRLDADEIQHYYTGSDLNVYIINPDTAELETIVLGDKNTNPNAVPQYTVARNTWFAATSASNYSLIGATVSPGFTYDTFQLAQRAELIKQYPQHSHIITRLTRDK